jgi:hypothetical protein
MKNLLRVGWVSIGIAIVILILGFIAKVAGVKIVMVTHITSYFILANSFLLLAIAIFIGIKLCYFEKCSCGEDKKELN